MPHNNPSTDPNIFDILINSIIDFLRHDPPKTNSSPPPKSPKTYKSSKPLPTSKTKTRGDDAFNFLEWLFNPVNPPNPTPSHTLHHHELKPQPRPILKTLCAPRNSRKPNVTFAPETKDPSPKSDPENRVIKSKVYDQNALCEKERQITEDFLFFFSCELGKTKEDLTDFEKIFRFGLSYDQQITGSSQHYLRLDQQEMLEFSHLLSKFKYKHKDRYKDIIDKSVSRLNFYILSQNIPQITIEDFRISDPLLSGIYQRIDDDVNIDKRSADIYKGLLNPKVEDNFFIKYFCKSEVGDNYSGAFSKPVILARGERLLFEFSNRLKAIIQTQSQLSHDDLTHIYSHIDNQIHRGERILREKTHYRCFNSKPTDSGTLSRASW